MTDPLLTLPKVELHLHLEGAMRPATMLLLAERNGVDIGTDDEDELAARFEFDDFMHFIRLFRDGLSVICTTDDIVTIANAMTDELAAQHVRWAEVTTTPCGHMRRLGISAADYSAALNQAQRDAAAKGIELRWIPDVSRGAEMPDDHLTADLLIGPHCPDGAVAMGIGGPELEWPARLFVDTFARARAAGVPAVVHAGEADGPQSVIDALDLLHSKRIGHGVRCLEDPALVQRLIEDQTMLEVSPTSNVLLRITPPSIEDHPLGELRRLGVNVCVNTDDPGYFRTTLNDELAIARAHHGYDNRGLAQLQRAAIEASFAPADFKRAFHAEIDAWEKSFAEP